MSIVSLFSAVYLFFTPVWHTDFSKAQNIALGKKQYILLNFSGSDWCVPCIRTKKEIFDSEVFDVYSKSNLVLLNADFPRLNKNKLSKSQLKENEILADKYNPIGTFPLTLLLSADGNIVKRWEGFPDVTAAEFVSQIKNVVNASGQ